MGYRRYKFILLRFWLSANGFKDFPTNTQLTDISAVIPAS